VNQPYPNQNPYPAPMPAPKPKKKRLGLKILLGVVAAFVVIAIAVPSSPKTPATTTVPTTQETESQAAPEPAAAPAAPTSWSSGTYQVVKEAAGANDVTAGRLKTAGPDKGSILPNCYWARLKDDSGDFRSIISNGNLQGPGSVTTKVGEFLQLTGDCVWTK
jgi:hypothetical protein